MTTPERPVCGDETDLTDTELVELAALEEPLGFELQAAMACELEAGHPGHHHSLGQSSGDDDWWPRWGANRELVLLAPCPAEAGDGETLCTLPEGHPAGHSFELVDTGGRVPSLEIQQRIVEQARLRRETATTEQT